MTDTTVLDAMMKVLERNPLEPSRLQKPIVNGKERSQFREVDDKPFYAKREVLPSGEMNPNYRNIVDRFHNGSLTVSRFERPRRGTCDVVHVIEKHIDGEIWRREERCGGLVHAVETVVEGAVRVDGRCLKCGTPVHRAGRLKEA